MKCLTVQQPWASLLLGIAPVDRLGNAPGMKDVENRKWATTHRGNLLIHAGKAFDKAAMELYYNGVPDDRFPRGVVMGMVHVDGMVGPGIDCGSPWGDRAQWNWRVSRPRVFAKYVELPGQLSIFEVTVPLVLEMAQAASGSSTTWWNGLSEGDREWFVERVGILEFEGRFSRMAAVHEAYAQFVAWKHDGRDGIDDGKRVDEVAYFGASEGWWHQWEDAHAG